MVVIREAKTFYFDFVWPKDADENLKHVTEFILKSNESLAENKIKNKIEQLMLKYKHGNDTEHGPRNTQNSKTNKPYKFVLNLSQRLD